MYKAAPALRIKVVQYYLHNGVSLHKTARRFGVHYQSVYKWTRWYKKDGIQRLTNTYKRPWNRTHLLTEQEVALLKEKDPTLTVRAARDLLKEKGIHLSLKGIWGIWRRYGYAGFMKDKMSDDFTSHCAWTCEAKEKVEQARELLKHEETRAAASILNSIPCLPKNTVIKEIPDRLCSIRRRVERKNLMFGTIPLNAYIKKTNRLYHECLQRELRYSALRVGISEIIALSWGLATDEQLQRTQELQVLIEKNEDHYSNLLFGPRLLLAISEGIARAHLSQVQQATKLSRTCRRLLRRRLVIPPNFMTHVGTLFNQLENYRESGNWYHYSYEHTPEQYKKSLNIRLAENYFLQGQYQKALNTLRKGQAHGWLYRTRGLFYRAMQSFMKGSPNRAIEFASKALDIARKEDLSWSLLKAYMAIASAYRSLNEHSKARYAIRRLVVYSRRLKRAESALDILLGSTEECRKLLNSEQEHLPTTKLAIMLKLGKYRTAYRFAERKGIMAYLHRFVFFAPEAVQGMIKSGKRTGLPRAVLKLPIFNQDAPVYKIRFLGPTIVYRNNVYVDAKLRPKESALLIHLANRIHEPGRYLSVEHTLKVFWAGCKQPTRNLSHLLVGIKKKLRMPTHFIEIRQRAGTNVLMNNGIYFVTDHREQLQKLATAHAFMRSGEHDLAQKEFKSAFALIRGEPFTRMYDLWSEEMRRAILDRIESEIDHYRKICRSSGDMSGEKSINARIKRVIPSLDEMIA